MTLLGAVVWILDYFARSVRVLLAVCILFSSV
jgi:hypothetical protein